MAHKPNNWNNISNNWNNSNNDQNKQDKSNKSDCHDYCEIKEPINMIDYSPFYNIISKLFSNTVFIKDRNVGMFSIYKCNVDSLLMEYRYLVAICDIDVFPLGTKIPLTNLNWKSFQTRTTTVNDNNKPQKYESLIDSKLNTRIKYTMMNIDKAVYSSSEFPFLKIELLPKSTKPISLYDQTYGLGIDKHANNYAQTMTLLNALSTFHCCLTIKE